MECVTAFGLCVVVYAIIGIFSPTRINVGAYCLAGRNGISGLCGASYLLVVFFPQITCVAAAVGTRAAADDSGFVSGIDGSNDAVNISLRKIFPEGSL